MTYKELERVIDKRRESQKQRLEQKHEEIKEYKKQIKRSPYKEVIKKFEE